jgi:RNA polymerase sigma factor (sigma-70 family)
MDAQGGREVREPSGGPGHLSGMGIPPVHDAELATLACAGEVEALGALLERYRPSLYAAAIRLLRNRDDALDAVQETCVIALLRLGSLRDSEAVGGWLHTVLRNTCLMRLRRNHRERPAGQVAVPALAPAPEEVFDGHALRDWVWAALGTLSPDDRLAVMLRYFSRCRGYQSIAAVTAVPVGTVRSRLNRARSQLSATLLQSAEGTWLSQAAPGRPITAHPAAPSSITSLTAGPSASTSTTSDTAGLTRSARYGTGGSCPLRWNIRECSRIRAVMKSATG